ncbi:hypothetical protein C2857_005724 [Epichloe festucae Fl1]|uniref:N-acetyltransferase domain-containing protein n=1 Tax=Epichloe festucae (strain Fl1) TaxID=877507 RepID=A0A7S9PUI2_EPIFF|nr:hypothetical protein C2857_005724 [Epichloe festucae Fl1]
MQDPAIQEATASEPLTLEEEYENQRSWRASHDKLTFIVCESLGPSSAGVEAGVADANDRMRGDVNFFIHHHDDQSPDGGGETARLRGEIDVMVAERGNWRKGYGGASVRCLLVYIWRNLRGILREYAAKEGTAAAAAAAAGGKMVGLMAKIKEGNEGSRGLFGKLGFRQSGEVNYFGEVMMVMSWEEVERLVEGWMGMAEEDMYHYEEVKYEL